MNSMNRREMLKLTTAGSVGVLATAAPGMAVPGTTHAAVPQWEVFELTLTGPEHGNPFTEVQLTAMFAIGHRTVEVDGFYDGGGRYKVRFMPDSEGEWHYTTASNAAEMAGKAGSFRCVKAQADAHGPVGVRRMHHFAYVDGTAFFPFGTTCYAWVHQTEELQQQTLAALRGGPFNKIRMCVFPKSYEYNHNEPVFYPFERSAAGVDDYTRPNPAFYAHLEQRIADLRDIGVEADLILFHPYDRWGYAAMPAEADDLYLRYILARLSAYRNIWWSLANEFDLMKAKTVQDFDRFFHLVEQHDPVGHLRSIHYSKVMYDYARPWVTHASLQTAKFEEAQEWLQAWKKPICFDEVMYEGNMNRRWGNLSGEEMTRRFWLGVVAGCYVTHGETYLNADSPMDEGETQAMPWSHGGALRGTSPARIGFLRKLLEESGSGAGHTGLEAPTSPYYLNATIFGQDEKTAEVILYYMDFHQAIYYEFPLPEGKFAAELIDPWAMTVSAVAGTFSGKTKLKLTGRPYQAVRFRRVI
ncbi:MAG: DUF5060 domain-containing protein [Acidobacteriaceae bacterium]|nr:DUF5060 domain-containing protein [Acidobacteriaceae bacterium]